jgi:hypothetical protein
MRGILDAVSELATIVADVDMGARVATSVAKSWISSPAWIVGAPADMVKAEESLARVKLGRRFSRDGVERVKVRARSSEVERVWTGDAGKERELSRGGLCRKSSKLLLSMVKVCGGLALLGSRATSTRPQPELEFTAMTSVVWSSKKVAGIVAKTSGLSSRHWQLRNATNATATSQSPRPPLLHIPPPFPTLIPAVRRRHHTTPQSTRYSTMGGFDFSNHNRNAALHAQGVPLPKATSTGTTIVGCLFDGGVVIAADTRATSGPIVADKVNSPTGATHHCL